jgi:uncharacterized protein
MNSVILGEKMETTLFASWQEILSGLFVGIVFGFLLRKAHVTRFTVIVKQLLLKDFTVMKVILTAVLSAGAGIAILRYFQPDLALKIDATTLFASIFGGAIFGVGMAIVGYCPGTAVGAVADGAKDMWFGLLGMIAGAAIYAESFEWVQEHIKPAKDMVKTTLPEYFGVSDFVIIGTFLACAVLYFFIANKLFKRKVVATVVTGKSLNT